MLHQSRNATRVVCSNSEKRTAAAAAIAAAAVAAAPAAAAAAAIATAAAALAEIRAAEAVAAAAAAALAAEAARIAVGDPAQEVRHLHKENVAYATSAHTHDALLPPVPVQAVPPCSAAVRTGRRSSSRGRKGMHASEC